ncbi:hypothetical protein D049_2163A, partial [Vibrio parahaemolyticus VPTS-2010]
MPCCHSFTLPFFCSAASW